MKLRHYLLLSVIVMGVFAFLMRGVLLKPRLSVAGPILVSHDLSTRYADNCDICHRRVAPFHEEAFGSFDLDTCMRCHGGAPITPHSTEGTYTECMGCHGGITASHDEMFPYQGTTYAYCVGCHPPAISR